MHIYIYVFVYLSNIFMCPETAGVDRLTLLTPGLILLHMDVDGHNKHKC